MGKIHLQWERNESHHKGVQEHQSKDRVFHTLEKFYIFRETKLENQINDKLTIKPNIIFETIVRHDHCRGLPNSCTQGRQQPTSVLQVPPSSSQ